VTAARLGASFDLLAAWQEGGVFLERDGVGIATGPGELVAPDEVAAVLRDRPEGVVAAGALPFAGGGWLVIGNDQVRRTDPFVTTKIGEGGATLVTGMIPAAAFGDADVTPVPAPGMYAGGVQEAVRRIRAGELKKVVLARTIEVTADRTFDPRRRDTRAARFAAGERGAREPPRRLSAAFGRQGPGPRERRRARGVCEGSRGARDRRRRGRGGAPAALRDAHVGPRPRVARDRQRMAPLDTVPWPVGP
jgi:hypothetical protein